MNRPFEDARREFLVTPTPLDMRSPVSRSFDVIEDLEWQGIVADMLLTFIGEDALNK